MKIRKLNVRRETLGELGSAELRGVVGGHLTQNVECIKCLLTASPDCTTQRPTSAHGEVLTRLIDANAIAIQKTG